MKLHYWSIKLPSVGTPKIIDDGVLLDSISDTKLALLEVEAEIFVLTYDPASGIGRLVRASSAFDKRESLKHNGIALSPNYDLIDGFVLGNVTYILGYTAQNGRFEVRHLTRKLNASNPYTYSRTREPGMTLGFTTVKSFTTYGKVGLLGYNAVNGNVAIYRVDVIAKSEGDLLPISISNTWSHQWAKGWTRFAFFTLGGAVFFLKTNTWRANVNVDHVWDHLGGTTEVKSHLDLSNGQKLAHCIPVITRVGDAYFLAYKATTGVLYRFHGDCAGWTEAVRLDLPSEISGFVAAPSAGGARIFALTPDS
jgi:hypothetical protein